MESSMRRSYQRNEIFDLHVPAPAQVMSGVLRKMAMVMEMDMAVL